MAHYVSLPCRLPHSLAYELQWRKHRDKASGGSSCLPPVFISDWDVTTTVTPHDSFSSLGYSLILKLPVLTTSVLPPCPALSDSCLQSCLETPAAVRMPGPCHLPSAGLLRVLVSSCQLDGWTTDKVESFHPSAGWTRSLKARVLKSFLQHGAPCPPGVSPSGRKKSRRSRQACGSCSTAKTALKSRVESIEWKLPPGAERGCELFFWPQMKV